MRLPKARRRGWTGQRQEGGACEAAGEPGVSREAKTELPRPAVYLRHSGEAELGTNWLIYFLHFSLQVLFREPSGIPLINFPEHEQPRSLSTPPSLWGRRIRGGMEVGRGIEKERWAVET